MTAVGAESNSVRAIVLETLLEDASRSRDRYLADYLDARRTNRALEAQLERYHREQGINGCLVTGGASPSVGRSSESIRNGRQGSHGTLVRAEVDPMGGRQLLSNGPSTELPGCAVTQDRQSVDPCCVEDLPGLGHPKTLKRGLDHELGDICDVLGNGMCEEPEPETQRSPSSANGAICGPTVSDEDGYPIGLPTTGKLVYPGEEVHQGDDEISTDTSIQHAPTVHDVTEIVIAPKEKQQPEHAVAQPIVHVEAHKKLAQQIAYCLNQLNDKMKLVCGMITSVSGSSSFNVGASRRSLADNSLRKLGSISMHPVRCARRNQIPKSGV